MEPVFTLANSASDIRVKIPGPRVANIVVTKRDDEPLHTSRTTMNNLSAVAVGNFRFGWCGGRSPRAGGEC